ALVVSGMGVDGVGTGIAAGLVAWRRRAETPVDRRLVRPGGAIFEALEDAAVPGSSIGLAVVVGAAAALDVGQNGVLPDEFLAGEPGGVVQEVAFGRAGLVPVLRVHQDAEADLLHVGEAGGMAGFGPRLRKNREKNSCQNRDYCYHDEQFDECKTSFGSHKAFLPPRRDWFSPHRTEMSAVRHGTMQVRDDVSPFSARVGARRTHARPTPQAGASCCRRAVPHESGPTAFRPRALRPVAARHARRSAAAVCWRSPCCRRGTPARVPAAPAHPGRSARAARRARYARCCKTGRSGAALREAATTSPRSRTRTIPSIRRETRAIRRKEGPTLP